ncbi:hypothetical protein E2C01_073958 [Portunus trituberculatus]|uniref:Uncharacterized protein n=1 Tax=Portunus trituberculatus TaxID=210409 RepID=A0A5B7I4B7_PORTR|nr:hypothetical protein [Portunus trituberculatus]
MRTARDWKIQRYLKDPRARIQKVCSLTTTIF